MTVKGPDDGQSKKKESRKIVMSKPKTETELRQVLPFEQFGFEGDLRFFLDVFLSLPICDGKLPDNNIIGLVQDEERKLKLVIDIEEFLKYPVEEQMFFLMHEASHILLVHMLRGSGVEFPEGWNIITDGILNRLLRKHYKSNAKIPTDENGNPTVFDIEQIVQMGMINMKEMGKEEGDFDGVASEEAYANLVAHLPPKPKGGEGGEGDGEGENEGEGEGGEGEGEGEGEGGEGGDGDDKDGNGNGNSSGKNKQKKNKPGKGNGDDGKDNDKDKDEGKGKERQKDMREKVKDIDKKRKDYHDEKIDMENVDSGQLEQLRQIYNAAKNHQYGDTAGNFCQALNKLVKNSFPFDEVLERIIFKEKYDFARQHRRVRVPNSYIPRRRNEKVKVYAAMDVSGSCFSYMEDFVSYITALPEFEEIVFFDTQIQATVRKGEQVPSQLPGWGGTDINPVMQHWEEVEKNSRGYKLNFVVVTDGEMGELQYGPRHSNVIILTTSAELHYKNAHKEFRNIKIDGKEK